MSYLAAAVANPITIDAGITYTYVMPQQGATEITVDDLADFDLTVTTESPASLSVNFTGVATALPQYFTATIRFLMTEGELTQDLLFKVLPDDATQRVPNITTINKLHVNENQKVNVKLKSDIAATLSASGLTGGLAVGSNHITGLAPDSSGYNVFTLSAINGDYVYYRYFVLVAGTGNTPISQDPFAFPAEIFP